MCYVLQILLTSQLTQIDIYNPFAKINKMAYGEENFLFYVMFWTILAMMLVLIYSLKQVIVTQKHIQSIDSNMAKLVREVLKDEEEILKKIGKRK